MQKISYGLHRFRLIVLNKPYSSLASFASCVTVKKYTQTFIRAEFYDIQESQTAFWHTMGVVEFNRGNKNSALSNENIYLKGVVDKNGKQIFTH